jgi:hypothetical protein
MIREIDRNDDVDKAHPSLPNHGQLGVFEVPDVVVDEVVPGRPKVGGEGDSEESAVHDEFNCEGEEDGNEDCEEDSLDDFLDHGHEDAETEVNLVLEGGEDVVEPEDDELQVGNDADHDEDNHIDVPFEAEVQQNLRVIQRREVHF